MFVKQLVLLCVFVMGDCGFWEMRKNIMDMEKRISIGGNLSRSERDLFVGNVMMTFKFEDYKNFQDDEFLPAQHFHTIKKKMEDSKMFSFIKQMPKAASLHTHILSAGNVDFIIKNFTYRENLYACTSNGKFKLKFFAELEENSTSNWSLVSELRKNDDKYDRLLKEKLTIGRTLTKKAAWAKLSAIFTAVYDLLTYRPIFEEYIEHILEELQADHIIYAELRGTFMELYEINGTVYDKMYMLQILQEKINNFAMNNSSFYGMKYIYAPYRNMNADEFQDHRKLLELAIRKYPKVIGGFDLVGFEDSGKSLQSYVTDLMKVDKNIRYFFHAGETNWHGTDSDKNLLDAALLGSTRIGHAFSLIKHPEILNFFRNKRIALEICPISNQLLHLVQDLRNHPAAFYIAYGLEIVVCNDNPMAFETRGLSYDYYEVFMGMTHTEAGLEFLEQINLNSIRHSALFHNEKMDVARMFEAQWANFMKQFETALTYAMTNIFGKLLNRRH